MTALLQERAVHACHDEIMDDLCRMQAVIQCAIDDIKQFDGELRDGVLVDLDSAMKQVIEAQEDAMSTARIEAWDQYGDHVRARREG